MYTNALITPPFKGKAIIMPIPMSPTQIRDKINRLSKEYITVVGNEMDIIKRFNNYVLITENIKDGTVKRFFKVKLGYFHAVIIPMKDSKSSEVSFKRWDAFNRKWFWLDGNMKMITAGEKGKESPVFDKD